MKEDPEKVETDKTNNPGDGLFCPRCKKLMYPVEDGWHECKNCGRRSKPKKRLILISKAKVLEERRIQNDKK